MERSDRRFDEVVDTTMMTGPQGRYAKSICTVCSTQHKVFKDENAETMEILSRTFTLGLLSDSTIEYVASMRAWNCCKEGQEPLDGFPDDPRS